MPLSPCGPSQIYTDTLTITPVDSTTLPSFNTNGSSNFALPLVLQAAQKDKLKDVCRILEEEKVEYRLGTAGGGNQALQPYLNKFNHRIEGELPNANYIHHNALYIGNHVYLTFGQIVSLTEKLNTI